MASTYVTYTVAYSVSSFAVNYRDILRDRDARRALGGRPLAFSVEQGAPIAARGLSVPGWRTPPRHFRVQLWRPISDRLRNDRRGRLAGRTTPAPSVTGRRPPCSSDRYSPKTLQARASRKSGVRGE